MPSIYQGLCSHCGHHTPLMTGEYYAVLVDEPVGAPQSEVAGAAIIRSNGDTFSTVDDPRFVVLAHPLEEECLARTGYRWRDLLREGRFVQVTNVICGECGTVFPRRRLAAPSVGGCVPSVALGAAVGLGVGWWKQSAMAGMSAWVFVTCASIFAYEILATQYVRRRFSKRAVSLTAERFCPRCQADNSQPIVNAKMAVCSSCRQSTLRFYHAGMS